MKILMINVVCGISSTGRICTDRAQELEAQGHEVRIAYGRGEVPERFRKYAVRIGTRRDIYLHVLGARLFDAMGFGSKRATERFLRWVEEYDPDEIHLHNLHGYYIHIERLFQYLRACGKRIIWTLHDCWAFTGHCSYFDHVDCNRWLMGCGSCPDTDGYPRRWLIDRSKRNFIKKRKCFTGLRNMTLVTPSQWLAGLVGRSFLREYPIEVRYNTIDTAVFRPTESTFRERYGLVGKRVLLGVANTWDDRKGFGDYLKLAELLGEEYRVVLVGVSPSQRRNLPSNVLGIERTDSAAELAAIYTAADVFLNLTYEDNYPTVNLEAEACGTPVITYDTGGCRETVHRKGSCVLSRGDLIEVVRRLREDVRFKLR